MADRMTSHIHDITMKIHNIIIFYGDSTRPLMEKYGCLLTKSFFRWYHVMSVLYPAQWPASNTNEKTVCELIVVGVGVNPLLKLICLWIDLMCGCDPSLQDAMGSYSLLVFFA